MDKVDLFLEHKSEYRRSKKPALVELSPATYLAFAGEGEPGSEPYQQAIEALFTMAYSLKFSLKNAGEADYKVCTLEGLYTDKTHWTLLIRIPDFIAAAKLRQMAAELMEKGKAAAVKRVTLERHKAARCVQMLQVGPYETICESMKTLESFAAAQGLTPLGRLHEIYFSDPRRVPPERLQTLVRLPVQR